jgi:hypothetical protein
MCIHDLSKQRTEQWSIELEGPLEVTLDALRRRLKAIGLLKKTVCHV